MDINIKSPLSILKGLGMLYLLLALLGLALWLINMGSETFFPGKGFGDFIRRPIRF